MKIRAVTQEEDGEDWHQEQDPDLLRRLGYADANALGKFREFLPMAQQKFLNSGLRVVAPAMLLAEIFCNLAGANLLHKSRESFAEASALSRDARTNVEHKERKARQQKQVDDRNSATTATHELLQS